MADAIVRLKVESQEYDSKLERATQKLQHMEKECRKIGGTFEYVDKEQMDLVKSLGQMETKATTARGKVAEMTKSYTELSLQYKRLSDQEKQSPFGKAMAQSLDQLKSRIKDANSEIKEVSQELGSGSNGLGGIMDALAGKIGIPTELLTKMGLAIGAVGAALKVAQDAFNANESLVDAWGRTVESATSLYEGFVTSLNTGDFGGFLSRMGEISNAARAAYDELDRLGTMKTIQGPEMSRQQAENDRNRAMLQTRRYIAPLDGSAGIAGLKTGDLLSDAQVKQIESDLQNGIKNISALIENEVQQTTSAIDAEYEKQASILGMSVEEFRKGTSSMAEFDKMIEMGKKYYEFENAHTKTELQYNFQSGEYTPVTTRDNAVNPFADYKKWSTFRVDGEDYNNLVKLIQQRDQQMSQAYSSQAQAYRTINRVEGITARGGGGGAKVDTEKVKTAADMWNELSEKIAEAERLLGEFQTMAANTELSEDQRNWAADMVKKYEDEIKKLKNIKPAEIPIAFSQKGLSELKQQINTALGGELFGSEGYALEATKIVDVTTLENLLNTALTNGLNVDMTYLSGLFESIKLDADIDDSTWDALVAEINAQLEALDLPKIKLDVTTGNITNVAKDAAKATDEWQQAVSAVGQLGGALQGLEDPSAKVAGIIAQAIANIALTFATSLKGTVTPWDWIAAAISGTATMIGTISAIKSATKGGFANGGIVPGNSFSGDNLHTSDYGINSGELILNRAQQNTIASQLQGGSAQNMRLEALISGESLRMVLANNASRRGGNRAQYAISKFG